MEGESYMQQSPSKNDEVEKALEKFEQGVQARNRAGYEELQNADIAIAAAGQFVSQLIQFNTPPSSAILLIFTATIFLSNISFALFTAVSS